MELTAEQKVTVLTLHRALIIAQMNRQEVEKQEKLANDAFTIGVSKVITDLGVDPKTCAFDLDKLAIVDKPETPKPV